jgi:hypothetical protein
MRLDLLDRLHVDRRPDHGTWLELVGDPHRARVLGDPLVTSVVGCPDTKFAKPAEDAHLSPRRLLHGSACLPKRD